MYWAQTMEFLNKYKALLGNGHNDENISIQETKPVDIVTQVCANKWPSNTITQNVAFVATASSVPTVNKGALMLLPCYLGSTFRGR